MAETQRRGILSTWTGRPSQRGIQTYVEEAPVTHGPRDTGEIMAVYDAADPRPSQSFLDRGYVLSREDIDNLDNPAPGYEQPEPIDSSTIAFTLAMATAFLGLFVPATAWWLPAALCIPTAGFIIRTRTDHLRKRRVRPVLLTLAVAGLVVGVLCSIWGYNTMQDLRQNLECLAEADISTYESGDC